MLVPMRLTSVASCFSNCCYHQNPRELRASRLLDPAWSTSPRGRVLRTERAQYTTGSRSRSCT